jgi:membrane-bound serine protease (ClpP class)
MRRLLCLLAALVGCLPVSAAEPRPAPANVFVVPIRTDIDEPLIYLVRRGVKAAMEAKADTLILDMDTNGGRVDVTEELIEIIGQFKGATVTFVNRKAFSAGAFISVATRKIYMAPEGVIGAATPVMLSPTSGGPEGMPESVEAKITSGISALIRATAKKNGHNPDVVDAMIDRTKELKIGDKVLTEKGQILTLTADEAVEKYGEPPTPLLAAGIVHSLDQLLVELGAVDAKVTYIEPTGAERLAFWINKISPLLLLVGMVCVYIEFKTPGFGLPGIVGIIAFAIYFLGGYVAGLSGIEWVAVFVLGLTLLVLELFVFPGTIVLGLSGALLLVVSLVMATVDFYPGMPAIPSLPMLELPLMNLGIAMAGAIVIGALIARFLPQVPMVGGMISQSASGSQTVTALEQRHSARLGSEGVAISPLRPGGKAQFGDELVDVVTQGEMIGKGTRIRIVGHSAAEAVVEAVPR